MKKSTLPTILFYILLLVIFLLYIWVRVENSQYIREPRSSFGDTHEFLDAAAEPLLSESFWISLRPPVVPLFYKMIGDDYQHISTFQLWFSILCWGALGLAVTNAISSKLLKPLGFLIVLAFSLSEEIIMWDYIILGDSISISITALFLAAALWLLSKWTWLRFTLLLLAALLFAFTRDDFAYYILMSAAVVAVLVLRTKDWKRPLLISVAFILMFFVSNTLSSASMRWERPVLNTISIRILPNPQYLAYFQGRGMPVNEALMERSGKHLHADDNALMLDPRLEEFRSWVRENGKSEYIRFLWFFKADTFQNVFNDIGPIFSPNVYYYTATRFRPIVENPRIDELLFPMKFGLLLFLIANLVAAVFSVVAFYEKKLIWVLPLALILLTYPQALLVWNADANDMARHALYHNILLRLGVWLLALFVLDFVLEKADNRFKVLRTK